MPKPSHIPDREIGPEIDLKEREPGVRRSSLETVPTGRRRTFTASEKLRLVKDADVALASGVRGALEAMLRKEGIYGSLLSKWRQQLGAGGEAGLTSRKPGRKPKLDAKDRQLLAVTKEVETLQRKLRVANALIELQKKAHELLGLTLPEEQP